MQTGHKTAAVNIGLAQAQREEVARLLGRLLADEFTLYTKTRNYHWNVVGPRFYALHTFLEEQYKMLDEFVDEVAERIRHLGGWAPGTMTEFLQQTGLKEEPGSYPDSQTMLANLLADHEAIINWLREQIQTVGEKQGDEVTSNFLQDLAHRHEKMAWMLRAHLEGELA